MADLTRYGLGETEQQFVRLYAETGRATQAAKQAGLTYKQGQRALGDPRIRAAMEAELKSRMSRGAIKALSVVEELMEGADSETVRLQAAKDVLDRAGYKPEHQHQTADSRQQHRSIQQLTQRIEELGKELGIDTSEIINVTPVDQQTDPPAPTDEPHEHSGEVAPSHPDGPGNPGDEIDPDKIDKEAHEKSKQRILEEIQFGEDDL